MARVDNDLLVENASLADGTKVSVICNAGRVQAVGNLEQLGTNRAFRHQIDAEGGLLIPSLCHSHIHLDKCFILDSCPLVDGSFQEALEVTGKAKSQFSEDDLLRRGRKLVQDSVKFGVTSMRAHVEVDEIVNFSCLTTGLALSYEFRDVCDVQIAAFAQEAMVGRKNAELLRAGCTYTGVSAVGSAPYVEPNEALALQNIDLVVELALSHRLHLDFHLDYNLSAGGRPPLIYAVLRKLHEAQWTVRNPGKTIAIGHATRLSLFTAEEWRNLKTEIGDLPVTFIGLPQSDLYMMGRGPPGSRPRGTLNVVEMIQHFGLSTALSVNNVANAFTPQGSGDPLGLCPLGVALYQVATPDACRLLVECVSTRSKKAIGGEECPSLQVVAGMPADLVLLHDNTTVQDSALNPSESRTTIKAGRLVAHRRLTASIVAY